MKNNRIDPPTLINVTGMVTIGVIVIVAVIVVAVVPAAADSINVVAVGGVSAIAGFLARGEKTAA